MVFEIVAFVVSLLVMPVWILWIGCTKVTDIFQWSTWLKASTITLLYITGKKFSNAYIVLQSSNFKLPLADTATLPIHQQKAK